MAPPESTRSAVTQQMDHGMSSRPSLASVGNGVPITFERVFINLKLFKLTASSMSAVLGVARIATAPHNPQPPEVSRIKQELSTKVTNSLVFQSCPDAISLLSASPFEGMTAFMPGQRNIEELSYHESTHPSLLGPLLGFAWSAACRGRSDMQDTWTAQGFHSVRALQ